MYTVRGEFLTQKNGIQSSVIIEIRCKTLKEAEQVKSERLDSYQNLKIIKEKQ